MALTARLLGRQLFGCQGLRTIYLSQFRPVTIKPRPYEIEAEEGHDERNMRLGRPQSPHLSIYKWQLTAVLSITHRCTGLMLAGYTGIFGIASLVANKPIGEVVQSISECYPNFFLLFKLGMIFPFTYHFFNGIRHLIWDTGFFLTMKGVYVTGYIMLLCVLSSVVGVLYYSEELKQLAKEEMRKLEEEKEKEAAAAAASEKSKKKKK